MANNLFAIPAELRIKILANLDAVSLTRCAMTCMLIYETVKNSSVLTYINQLHFSGLCTSGIPLTQPYHELVELLYHRRLMRMFPKWTIDATLQMRRSCLWYDLSGVIFVSTDTRNLELGLLPTVGSTNESGVLSKSLRKPHFAASRIAVDMSQNLIIMIENDSEINSSTTETRVVDVHIRTLLDTPHPLAAQDHLQFIVAPDMYGNTADNACLQIARHTLSLFFHTAHDFGNSQPRVLIWDWVTSELLLDSETYSPPLLPSLQSDFALLDAMYFFVTCVSNSGSIKLYMLSRSLTSDTEAVHLATFHLPATSPGVEVQHIASYAGSIEQFPVTRTPFAVHDDDRLHVFTTDYTHRSSASIHIFHLFVHQRVLTRYCVERARSQDLPLDVPWAAWGPRNTKMMYAAERYSFSGPGVVHGQRAVHPQRDPAQIDRRNPSYNSIEVLDFSLEAVLSARGVLPMPQSSLAGNFTGKLLSSSTINASQCTVFEQDVETHLPCVSFAADLERRYTKVMVYADGIVGLDFSSNLFMLIPSLDVYTF